MIRIRYTFKTADNRTSWDTSLFKETCPIAALDAFAQSLPAFALARLQTVRIFACNQHSYEPEEIEFRLMEAVISKFIYKHAVPI